MGLVDARGFSVTLAETAKTILRPVVLGGVASLLSLSYGLFSRKKLLFFFGELYGVQEDLIEHLAVPQIDARSGPIHTDKLSVEQTRRKQR